MAAAEVTPSIRATGIVMLAGSSPSTTLNAAFTSPVTVSSSVSIWAPLSNSLSPRVVLRWMSPGVTQRPAASTRVAPSGMVTFAPTATIFPSRSTTVPPGIFGPETG
jgi:hypothetical protein